MFPQTYECDIYVLLFIGSITMTRDGARPLLLIKHKCVHIYFSLPRQRRQARCEEEGLQEACRAEGVDGPGPQGRTKKVGHR